MTLPKPLPGLMRASFRGVSFFVPDVKSSVGRRVAAHYFPGLDVAAYDDMGLAQERISFDALYVGDDYITHGRMLKTTFETPGPGTLVHPWFGAVSVILIEPAEISFSSTELRVVRISVEFERVAAAKPSALATGASLAFAALEMMAAARGLKDAVEGRVLSRLKSDSAARVAELLGAFFENLHEPLGARLRAVLPVALPSSTGTLAGMVGAMSGLLIEMAQTSNANAAVAPAAGVVPVMASLSPEDIFTVAVVADAHMRAMENEGYVSFVDEALNLFVRGEMCASAAHVTREIDFTSRAQAIEVRGAMTNALNNLSNPLRAHGHGSLLGMDQGELSGEVSDLYRATRQVKLWVISDLNEIIGRLPQTKRITLAQDTDAFVLANRLYGDDISAIEAGYLDIIARNRLRHPALIEAGQVEILP